MGDEVGDQPGELERRVTLDAVAGIDILHPSGRDNGAEPRHVELTELEVPFGAELVRYSVGPGSCAVPGVAAGLGAL